jgi:hypothetical protein
LKLALAHNEALMLGACDFAQSQIEKDRPVAAIDQVMDTMRVAVKVAAATPGGSTCLVGYVQRLLDVIIDLGHHQHNAKKLFLIVCERMQELLRLVSLAKMQHPELQAAVDELFAVYAFSDAGLKGAWAVRACA